MKLIKYLSFLLLVPIISCSQTITDNQITGLIIDPKIEEKAKEQFEDSEQFKEFNKILLLYMNSGEVQSYLNDSLITNRTFEDEKIPFKTFHLWQNDTLTINGGFGIWGGVGFGIEIVNKKARLYHMLSSDDFPTYSYSEKDSLIFRLEVPCNKTKIVVSDLPDSTVQNQIIYGYIEFESEPFYSSAGSADGEEILPRQKIRNNMKLYFKSKKINMPNNER